MIALSNAAEWRVIQCDVRASVKWMAARGWTRTDGGRGKVGAVWTHRAGWTLSHCGHMTALHPWILRSAEGVMCLTGSVNGRPELGACWDTLSIAATYVEELEAAELEAKAVLEAKAAEELEAARADLLVDPTVVRLLEDLRPIDLGDRRLEVRLELGPKVARVRESCGRSSTYFARAGAIVFSGGAHGDHQIDLLASDAARILAHWNGYLEANGVVPRRLW